MRRRGFTLLEVLLALAIIGVAFGVLAATQVTTLGVTAESRRASDATGFANGELERAVQAVLLDFAGTVSACAAGCLETHGSGGGRFVGTTTTEPVGSGYLDAGLMRVTVTLTAPAPVSFTRLVSCIDVHPAPSIAAPFPCPGASE